MTEDFLHYLWKFKVFETRDLQTTSGEHIEIYKNGEHNFDAGPDFSDARIKIGDQLWAGNVEIHVSSSDWAKHKHNTDKAYDSVILHVVYKHDVEVKLSNGYVVPTLELSGLFDEHLYWKYEALLQNKAVIACAEVLPKVESIVKESMLERVLVERMEDKSKVLRKILDQNKGDWNESFYQWLAYGFGLKVNAEPMLMLAQNIPYNIIAKHRNNILQIEALLFGVSGLLPINKDEKYVQTLQKEYAFLKKKYALNTLESSVWKFFKLRPPSFPTRRIAQLASMLHQQENIFSKVLATGNIEILEAIFTTEVSSFWNTHYHFDKEVASGIANTAIGFKRLLIINIVVPFLFLYGHVKDEAFYKQRALDLLEQLKPEDNKIVRLYKKLHFDLPSAFYSQAVLQLHKCYCKPKKCLNCAIGNKLLDT